ncbi:MAG TPA: cysteine desulfurase family protein [Patescibacteria group bacterium]|nr:cysteine desulfurase family protein [Patescibacteria group bacterium]
MENKTTQSGRIYLDCSATTPTDPRVMKKMCEFMEKDFGNPSSVHAFGREARGKIEEARRSIAEFIGSDDPMEVIFTSGGTESDNMAIVGVVKASKVKKPHIITSVIEHKAVLSTIEDLEKRGLVEATYLKVDGYGKVNLEDLKKEIKYNTILVSIMYVNNEIGTVQPIREIGKYLEKLNDQRERGGFPKVYFHTDAVQAFQYLNVNVKHLHVDLMSVSGHKFYAPKGIGLLFIKKGTHIEKIQIGGGQEFGKRAGTENTPGIIALSAAIDILKKEGEKDGERIGKLKDKLVKGIEKIENVTLTGHPKDRIPSVASFLFHGIEGEAILINLDLDGIAVSTGSACSSGSLEASHVLLACGYDHEQAQGNIRFSLGRFTQESDIKKVLEVLPGIVDRLREMSPIAN